MLSEAKQILLQLRYSILLADCGIANALYNNILWFPYYFTALNFPNQAAVISILYISMSAVGSFSFEALMSNHEKWSPLLAGVFLGVSVFIGVIMLHFSF
jgi:phosphoglycerol transferase MdoB-like AlkP superfamily enzyme